MPSISACPQCQRNILIFSLVNPSQKLRCPHCQQDFVLEAVLSNCVELPPIAEPVDEFASQPPWSHAETADAPVEGGAAVVSEPVVPEPAAPESAATTPQPETVSAEKAPEEIQPAVQETTVTGEQPVVESTATTAVAESATSAGEATAPALGSEATAPVSGDVTAPTADATMPPPVPAEFLTQTTDGAAVATAEIRDSEVQDETTPAAASQTAETSQLPAAAESTAEATTSADEATASETTTQDEFAGAVSIQRGPRRPRQGVGWFGQLVALVLGGVMGLSIGYYALLWIGGREKDFLKIADKLPSWAVPKKAQRWNMLPAGHDSSARSLGDLLDAPDTPPPSLPGGSDNSTNMVTAASYEGKLADLSKEFHAGPRNFIPYSAAQLSQAVADVDHLLTCEHCGSTGFIIRPVSVKKESPSRHSDGKSAKTEKKIPCEECHGKPNGRITPEAFEKLCRLAETVCFAKIGEDDPNLAALRQSVLSVVAKAGSDNNKTQVIGRLAGYLLENGHREHNGIVLAGRLQEVVREGELFRFRLVLFGVPKTVTVVSHLMPNPPLKPQDRVIILGSIVDDPVNNVAGYAGQLPQIVWGGLPYKLQNDLP